eukprot:TRINITY_DN9638_c0_g1_i1.p1 TRINITY_DN9638_c0_g1~~TRINITY_DN9638_c0_g1_i1.p1  ORF type:complete len:372 (+),score=42.55 TRINITY_DN9638_c0_g1_i1:1-1116(+)
MKQRKIRTRNEPKDIESQQYETSSKFVPSKKLSKPNKSQSLLRMCLSSQWFWQKLVATCVVLLLVYSLYDWTNTKCWSFRIKTDANKNLKKVPYKSTITLNQLHRYYKSNGIPVILSGIIPTYPAYHTWNLSYFSDMFGDETIKVNWGNVENDNRTYFEHMTADEYFTIIESYNENPGFFESVPYWAEGGDFLFESYPELMDDLDDLFPFYDSDIKEFDFYDNYVQLWVGPAGTITGLHQDQDPLNFLLQIRGEKRVTIYSPYDEDNLYISSKYEPGSILSQIDPKKPDLNKFPKLANAKPLTVVLKAGEMMFIPSGWFHTVEALTASISITARGEFYCEGASFWFDYVLEVLHNLGLYKKGNCICHNTVG